MPAGRPRSDQQLNHCREEGMRCSECVERVAGSMARICKDLSPSIARQLFSILYPEQTCSQMSGAFVQVVAAQTPRRMPGRELRIASSPAPREIAAVAVA